MSSATSNAQALPDGLDFYRVRDDMAREYNPVGALELMLVTQIAQAWLCLQQAYETQRRYFQAHDVLEAIATQFDQYKAVTREVTNCERVWRHALLHLEKRQRQRRRGDFGFTEMRRPAPRHPDSDPTPGPRTAPGPAPETQPTTNRAPSRSGAKSTSCPRKPRCRTHNRHSTDRLKKKSSNPVRLAIQNRRAS